MDFNSGPYMNPCNGLHEPSPHYLLSTRELGWHPSSYTSVFSQVIRAMAWFIAVEEDGSMAASKLVLEP